VRNWSAWVRRLELDRSLSVRVRDWRRESARNEWYKTSVKKTLKNSEKKIAEFQFFQETQHSQL